MVESRGWRVPIYLGGGLVALAILGVILAIAALSNQEQQTAGNPTPSPGASAAPPAATPTISPIPTSPSVTPSPTADPGLTPEASPTEDPTTEITPEPTVEPSPEPDPDPGSGTFESWTGGDGDYTIIIESADNLSRAEEVAQEAQDKGLTVGILNSDDYSNLNGGYQVVFSGTYSSESEAEDALPDIKAEYSDAYIKRPGSAN
ncbi:SPOR domain-containing protein [Solirubrobacter deserti]|uniref:SPOR domain-containing protein n=1 Tax=Solirubrobacter deserti TaxID=2282478 RepID=A0ABT4RUK6_9ACTN|nr:SPOR domain-containing protein [Solirubrobacter deserti]MDA0142245.1 SPOR domain-containing protein [Solirubrobacter deserti]